ncbi:MAG: flagellar protein FlgN [Roseburia sp.]|nr:flagellar protein FlgN [Roseburia sp.]MCM1099043.1 flagellar protein FlgN [Ruminococcus flavefaciens]
MASLMECLIEVLEQESNEYEGLLSLSQKKTPVIVSGNLEELQKITDDEQELVSRIAHLEKKRAETTADIANVLNRDVTILKLDNLIGMLAARPQEQQRLAAVHDRLRSAVRGLQRTNEQNRELLVNALEMVEFEMNLLQASKAAPETANYTRGAYNTGDTMGVSSRGFDAKQ